MVKSDIRGSSDLKETKEKTENNEDFCPYCSCLLSDFDKKTYNKCCKDCADDIFEAELDDY